MLTIILGKAFFDNGLWKIINKNRPFLSKSKKSLFLLQKLIYFSYLIPLENQAHQDIHGIFYMHIGLGLGPGCK